MKNSFKMGVLAAVIAVCFAACAGHGSSGTDTVTVKKDSTVVKVDSTTKDTSNKVAADTTKKDTTKKK